MNNKHECQSNIGEIVPMFQKRKQSEKPIHNDTASFSNHTTSSPRHFNFSKNPLSFDPVKTSSPNMIVNSTPHDSTLNSVLSPVILNINDSSSLSSVKSTTNTNFHGVFDHQSPQDFFPSWYSSESDKKITPIKLNSLSYSPPKNSAYSPSTLTDLDSWRQSYSVAANSNLSVNSEVKERKTPLNIAFHPQNSKCLSSPNPSTSSSLTFDNTGTNNAIENNNEELVQMHSQDDSNSSPTSPAVFSRQQIDENQKENMKMLYSTLGGIIQRNFSILFLKNKHIKFFYFAVTKENVQFLQNICNIFKEYLDDEKHNEIEQNIRNIVVVRLCSLSYVL